MIQTGRSTTTRRTLPTCWGLNPIMLHDRFWAARRVQVVRQGENSEIVRDAELFLLIDARALVVFRMGGLIDRLQWLRPGLLTLRLAVTRDQDFREQVRHDRSGRFLGIERFCGATDALLRRVALTPDRRIAMAWQAAPDARTGWKRLRSHVPRKQRMALTHRGEVFDRFSDQELMACVQELVRVWQRPDAAISRARHERGEVWGDESNAPLSGARFTGPVWVGAGRENIEVSDVVGPAVLWDHPLKRPVVEEVQWMALGPAVPMNPGQRVEVPHRSLLQRGVKRAFDVVFALLALAVTLPLYPFIMLAILIEDGFPFFFSHRRETLGGREFACIKFRSMRRDAEKQVAKLQALNKSDGHHVLIDPEKDPRLLRVGRFLRKYNLDELPQFLNVLMGHMSVVGPRPSPRRENQGWTAWREARLSVRPGVTGLWQVMRTRAEGVDFQEWVRYDLEYVQRQGWKLDLWIIWQTVLIFLRLRS